jgi:hypothetical protein
LAIWNAITVTIAVVIPASGFAIAVAIWMMHAPIPVLDLVSDAAGQQTDDRDHQHGSPFHIVSRSA